MSSKIRLLLFSAFFLPNLLNAQNYIYEWARSSGGVNQDRAIGIDVDSSGNVYTTGFFNDTVDFDPGPGVTNLISEGGSDVFVQKMDANGDLLWVRRIGGTSSDVGNSLVVDANGNVYTIGVFENSVDFDPGAGTAVLNSLGNGDIFIQKMDANGNFIWAKQIGGNSVDAGRSIVEDTSGHIYVTGGFSMTVDFDPGAGSTVLNSVGETDAFILKLDTAGNFVWVNQIGGVLHDDGISIALDPSGNIFYTGHFSDVAFINPGTGTTNLVSSGGFDIFVQKMDANGTFLWTKQLGGTSIDVGNSLAVDLSGNVFTTGKFSSTVDFDPGAGTSNLTAVSFFDIFVQKMDPNGDFVWARQFGGSFPSEGLSIALDGLGNPYTTGYFGGVGDFDPGVGTTNLSSSGGRDIFIQKMDASGNFLFAEQIGGSLTDAGQSITLDGSGNVYTAGFFSDTVDFEIGAGTTNFTSEGIVDLFIQKINPCVVAGTDVITACIEHTWIDGNTYTSDNDSATFNIVGGASNGCDSLVTLDLTILNSANGTDTRTECDSYTWIDGNTYTSDNNSATFNIAGGASNGCDSLVTLDLTLNTVNTNTTVSGTTITSVVSGAMYQWLDCENGMSVIPGETSQSFSATANGNYAVVINENNCTDTSACVAITTVGISENSFNDQFVISPNPTKGKFSVEFNQVQENLSVRLSSVSGQFIKEYHFRNTGLIELELNQPKGVYLLEFKDRHGETAVLRIVKE